MIFTGTIIEESLDNKAILKKVKIIKTKVEKVTAEHQTPWIKQWTLHTIEITEEQADIIAKKLSESIDKKHKSSWYVDFKNDKVHYIIFCSKFFKVNKNKKDQFYPIVDYAVSIGIPKYQLSFDPDWKKNPKRL